MSKVTLEYFDHDLLMAGKSPIIKVVELEPVAPEAVAPVAPRPEPKLKPTADAKPESVRTARPKKGAK